MWALGVIATVAAIAALARYFTGRDTLPPMERHERALDALRNLAEQPRPAASDSPSTTDTPTDHVRILAEAPGDTRPARRAPTRRSSARPAWVTDLPTIPIRPGGARPEPGPPGVGPAAPSRPPSLRMNDTDDGTRHGFAVSRWRLYAAATAAAALLLVAIVVAVGVSSRGTKGAGASKAPARDVLPSTTVARATSTSTPSTTVPSNLVPVVTRTTNGATVFLRSPFVLTLRTTAPCWVDITDTSGTTLFTATLPGGQQQQIPGSGPIVMKLGNMSAMKISANGVDLDLSGLPQTANITFQAA
ncbi:MAG: hypothetical protein QOF59_2200 [Actinomycetota bacterium]|nr:hypothetical protein [Actinomycetota bacterium]